MQLRSGIADQQDQGVHDFAEVVRRNVRRHPDRDPAGSVHEQVRELRRQDDRFPHRPVEVVHPVDRVLLEVLQDFFGDLREPAFRVPHRGGLVLRAAPVPLPLDERVAEGEGLHHAREGVVDRGIAMGMVPTEAVPHHARGLPPLARRRRARLVHRVQDAPLDRLQSVPDVRQGPAHDDGHRVVDVRPVHFLFNRSRSDSPRRFLRGLVRHRSPRCPGSRLPSRVPGCIAGGARPPPPSGRRRGRPRPPHRRS